MAAPFLVQVVPILEELPPSKSETASQQPHVN